MADNFNIDPSGTTVVAADDISGVIYPRSKLVHGADGVNAGDVAENNPLPVGEYLKLGITDSFTRPANTTAYTALDLVANSTTAGSVVPMTFAAARANDVTGQVLRAVLHKSGTNTINGTFRLHLFSSAQAVANGDNGAFVPSALTTYLGCLEGSIMQAGTAGSVAFLTPVYGSSVPFAPASGTQNIFGLLEARSAYAPASEEVFTITLEVA